MIGRRHESLDAVAIAAPRWGGKVIVLILSAAVGTALHPATVAAQPNPVVIENQQPGTSAWQIPWGRAGDDVQGQITASLGGVTGTVIAGTDSGATASMRSLIFQVTNPPSGAQTATVSWTDVTMNADVGVITVSGADQTTPCTNGTFAASDSRPAATTSVAIASSPGDLTASVGYTGAAWILPFTNQSLRWGVDSGESGGDVGPGTGTTTHTWTDWYYWQTHAVSGANFKAAR